MKLLTRSGRMLPDLDVSYAERDANQGTPVRSRSDLPGPNVTQAIGQLGLEQSLHRLRFP